MRNGFSDLDPFSNMAVILPSAERLAQLKAFNLTEAEYHKICRHLEREPNFDELAMFSVLWSEHCCYKNSRHLLKTLPSKGKRVLHGPGENAGVVDIGDGIQIAFKIESHNHPTAVEPFQGAATGVGGILRDIFTMNARPIANLNALRFGPILGDSKTATRNRYLLGGAVNGIAHYGNCVGVPTVGGELFFDPGYSGNPLVNAMAVGIVYDNEVMSSFAKGVGNPVLYVGSATGKDGMGGAAFASRELHANSQTDRPAVQVGDPFMEKLLIEACLEAFATGCVVAAQDMGAAGLTSSSCEMAAKGDLGMILDLDKVPAREEGMRAWEYLLSESQERMLFVLEKGREQTVLDVFDKWRIPAKIVGEVTADKNIRILHHGQEVVNLPAALLTDLAPSYNRGDNPKEGAEAMIRRRIDLREGLQDFELPELGDWLTRMLASTNIAEPRGIFSQYDRHVGNNTQLSSEHLGPGVIRLRKKDGDFSGKALAMTVDCNARYVFLNPLQGAQFAVCQAIRNLTCSGAEALAVSDNLNFGNPEKPEIYYQLFSAVRGIKLACEHFDIPVVSGNVSLYNEHSGEPIFPTPTIAMVGLIEDERLLMTPQLKQAGLKLALMGRFRPVLSGSEYAYLRTGRVEGECPDVDLNQEKRAVALVRQWIAEQRVQALQDVSLGGFLPTLLEMAFAGEQKIGLQVTLDMLSVDGQAASSTSRRLDELLFGESGGSYLVAYPAEAEAGLKIDAEEARCAFLPFGETKAEPTLTITHQGQSQSWPLEPFEHSWRHSLARL
jgi:phosphoribosylformylglycinamidine synthase II